MTKRVNTSGNAEIDALLWGWKWSSLTLTYSFPDSAEEYTDDGYEAVEGFQPSMTTRSMRSWKSPIRSKTSPT